MPDRRPLPPRLTRRQALFLDFDGTLAPIQDDPDSVELPEGGAALLTRIADGLDGALCVLSGRDLRDLARRTPSGIWRAGGHGLERCPPGEQPGERTAAAPEGLLEDILSAMADLRGVRVEAKGPVIAVHYRQAPTLRDAVASRLDARLSDQPGYRLQAGKMVFEAKPADAHKGRALDALRQDPPFAGRVPVMIGDDTTDEEAMSAAMAAGGWAARVGPGESVAAYGFNTPDEVWRWLRRALG